MRFLLLVLFLLNLAVAGLSALEHLQHEDSAWSDDAQNLVLLSERNSAAPIGTNGTGMAKSEAGLQLASPVSGGGDNAQTGQVGELKTCLLVGPIGDPLVLDESKRLFDAYGISIEELVSETAARTEFLVYLPPVDTRNTADSLIIELRELGFEGFLISQGELRGGISLGLYTARASADELVEKLRGNKISPEIRELRSESFERRLVTRSEVPSIIKAELLGLLAARDPTLEHKEIICK